MSHKVFAIFFTALFMILLFIGCAGTPNMPGMPGYISESTSAFDGSKQLSMEPAWLDDSIAKLSLLKSTKMKGDKLVLTVIVKGTYTFRRFESLHFNVDGEIVSFKSIDSITNIETSPGFSGSGFYFPPSNWSFKRYIITEDFLKHIISAERVVVKIELSKTFVEGVFSKDDFRLARPAFIEFYKKLQPF